MTAETVTVLFLFGTVALRVGLVMLVMWLLVPRRRTCPACGHDTAALVTGRVVQLVRLEKRWCLECGWWGFSKRIRASLPHSPRLDPHPAVPGT